MVRKKIPDLKLIDPRIRGAILELNESGYRTDFSCAGHNRWEDDTGEVVFSGRVPYEPVRRILESRDIDVISISTDSNPYFPKPRTTVRFKCLGGSRMTNLVDPDWEYPKSEGSPTNEEIAEWFRKDRSRRLGEGKGR